jgi:hypothetical protein
LPIEASPLRQLYEDDSGDFILSIEPTDPFDTLLVAMPKHVETWFNFCKLYSAYIFRVVLNFVTLDVLGESQILISFFDRRQSSGTRIDTT